MTRKTANAKRKLSAAHRERFIRQSAISKEVASQRGYRSIVTSGDLRWLAKLGFEPYQIRPGLLIPIWFGGEIVSWQLRPDRPRRLRETNQEVKYENLPRHVRPLRLDVHPSMWDEVAGRKSELWITEGIRKGDALTSAGCCTVALYSVWQWRGQDESGALRRLSDWDEIHLKNRTVYVVFDSDVMYKRSVQQALERLGKWLESKGADVQYVYLPDADDGSRQGIDDFLADSNTLKDIDEEWISDRVRGFPEVRVREQQQIRDTVAEVYDAIVQANEPTPVVFRRGREGLVLYQPGDGRTGPWIQQFDKDLMKTYMGLVADFVRYTDKGRLNKWPPADLAADVLVLPKKPDAILYLEGFTESPTIRPDGTVLDRPGYDAATGLYYTPSPDLQPYKFPERPTERQVKAALRLLWEMVCDFPFESKADRANYLGVLLTPVLLPAIPGPIPMCNVGAPQEKNGKTLLVQLVAVVITGRQVQTRPIPTKEEEWKKDIPAALRNSPVLVVYDNLAWKLRSPALAQTLSADEAVASRELGLSTDLVVSPRTTWIVTGKNIQLDTDLATRNYPVRLNAQLSAEELRERAAQAAFRHPDVLGWALENRSKLLAAVVTVARNYWAKGCPEYTGPVIPGYEGWSRVVGGVLEAAGVSGFLANLEEMHAIADEEAVSDAGFARAIHEVLGGHPYAMRDLYHQVQESADLQRSLPVRLAEALEKSEGSFTKVVGWWFKDHKDRVYQMDGYKYTVRRRTDSHTKTHAGYVTRKRID